MTAPTVIPTSSRSISEQSTWQQTGVFESPAAVPVASGFANSLALSWSGQYFSLGARTYSTETSTWGAVFNYGRQAK